MEDYQSTNNRKIEENTEFHLINPEILDYSKGTVRVAKNSTVNQFGINPIDVSGAGANINE